MVEKRQMLLKNLLKRFKDVTRKRICKICFKEYVLSSQEVVFNECYICEKCYQSFPKLFAKEYLEGIKVTSLYLYANPLDRLIMQYKELLDIELSPVFLSRIKYYLKLKYFNYHIVLLPSSKESLEKRGFNHLYEMFKVIGLPIIKDVLLKIDSVEQKNFNHLQRLSHRNFIRINENIDISKKNILLVDDVFSTGATLKEAIKMIKSVKPCRIQALVLCRNKNITI